MIYLRSRLGRAMLAIGKGGLPGPHSTSPGSQPLQFSFSQAATLETLPWGISMPPASRWLDHSEEKIKVLNQQASVFPWARTWTSLTFVPAPPSPPGTKTSCSWPAPSFMLHWITFCCALYLPGLYRQVSEWITYCGQAPSDSHYGDRLTQA